MWYSKKRGDIVKIAYAGFDLFYPVLQSLFENGCEIVKIFSCTVDNVTETNHLVRRFAEEHNIPITFEKITPDDLKELEAHRIDALFCAAYYYRVPITDKFSMINIHPSLLPQGRGAWPMPLYILNNIKEAGVTIHKMAEGFDTGDIIMQRSFELDENDTHETFMQKANSLLSPMITELLGNFENYLENAVPQSEGEYWDCPNEDDYVITPDTDFALANKILRAFYGFYVTYKDKGKEYRLRCATAVKGDNENEVFKIKDGFICVPKTY